LGYADHFRPTYAPRHAGAGLANVGHPSIPSDDAMSRTPGKLPVGICGSA
jgi:hypothetical protein